MNIERKVCERCSSSFERPIRCSNDDWRKRQFCSHSCAATIDGPSRFFANSAPDPTSGCWLWTGGVESGGYGTLCVNKISIRAHRYSFQLHKGPIPDGCSVLHHCDTPLCVNPDHLYAGTYKENIRDRDSRNRNAYGTRMPNAKLSDDAVRAIRASGLPHTELAKVYGVSPHTVMVARSGKTWGHVR